MSDAEQSKGSYYVSAPEICSLIEYITGQQHIVSNPTQHNNCLKVYGRKKPTSFQTLSLNCVTAIH